jgi:hypothetical protein
MSAPIGKCVHPSALINVSAPMNFCTFELRTFLSQPPDLKELSIEEKMKEALQVVTPPQKLSMRRATAAYDVPETILRR